MAREATRDVMAVLVVYERDLEQVAPWQTLRDWLDGPFEGARIRLKHLLIYDNSRLPRAQPPVSVSGCEYLHDTRNGGTAAAYQAAITSAAARDLEWLLLLDHDTVLPPDFLDRSGLDSLSPSGAEPAAVVPWVRHGRGTIVSPSRVTRLGTVRALSPNRMPRTSEHLTAISSGCLLHVPTLRTLLPFPPSLWLDYVDHWLFAQLHRRGLDIRISNQELQHDLSVATPGTLSPVRLVSILQAEVEFTHSLGLLARCCYPLRLGRRVVILAWHNPRLARTAVGWFCGVRRRQRQKLI
jgi:hypothetical protein